MNRFGLRESGLRTRSSVTSRRTHLGPWRLNFHTRPVSCSTYVSSAKQTLRVRLVRVCDHVFHDANHRPFHRCLVHNFLPMTADSAPRVQARAIDLPTQAFAAFRTPPNHKAHRTMKATKFYIFASGFFVSFYFLFPFSFV